MDASAGGSSAVFWVANRTSLPVVALAEGSSIVDRKDDLDLSRVDVVFWVVGTSGLDLSGDNVVFWVAGSPSVDVGCLDNVLKRTLRLE